MPKHVALQYVKCSRMMPSTVVRLKMFVLCAEIGMFEIRPGCFFDDARTRSPRRPQLATTFDDTNSRHHLFRPLLHASVCCSLVRCTPTRFRLVICAPPPAAPFNAYSCVKIRGSMLLFRLVVIVRCNSDGRCNYCTVGSIWGTDMNNTSMQVNVRGELIFKGSTLSSVQHGSYTYERSRYDTDTV